MIYVFTFIGEFGYEMFNWQGVIRKWAKKHKNPDDKIFIYSRQGLKSLYMHLYIYIYIYIYIICAHLH